jgi:hypothetical protein
MPLAIKQGAKEPNNGKADENWESSSWQLIRPSMKSQHITWNENASFLFHKACHASR